MSAGRLHPDDLRAIADLAAQINTGPSLAVPAPALLDAKAAAELLGVPASWVAAEARADRIPHVRLGRYVRFERDELEAWWRSRARGPRGQSAASAGSGPAPKRSDLP